MYTTDDRDNSRICKECQELFYPEQNVPYITVCEDCMDAEDLVGEAEGNGVCGCPYCTGAMEDDSYD